MKAVRLYAQVLVDVLSSPNMNISMEMTLKELDGFSKLLGESPLMAKVFDNPVMAESDKQKTLSAFVQKLNVSPMGERFLGMLIKRNRLSLLPQILTEVESIRVQKNGGLMGELISAVPLDGSTVSSVSQAISKKMNKTVLLKERVDPSLIAGLRVTVGGKTFDSTVRSKLDKVKDSFQ